MSLADLSKEMGRRWQEMADKTNYEALAEEDRVRYTEEMAEYKKSTPQPPKRAMTSYIIFCNEVRGEVSRENPDMAMGDIGKELGKRWHALTESEKTKYQNLADEDKRRFAEEKALG